MKKGIITFLFVAMTFFAAGCIKTKTVSIPPESETKTELPDYYIEDGILHINRVYYSVEYHTGQNNYIYETPWEKEKDSYTKLDFDGELICTKDESKEGKPYISFNGLFADMDNLTDATVTMNLNKVSDVSFLLADCDSLKSATVNINGAPIDSAAYMFEGCSNLVNADVFFANDQPENVKRMFYECTALRSGNTNLSKNVTDCTEMYYGCKSMPGADIKFEIGPDTKFSMMFGMCESLSGVSMSNVRVTKGGQAFFDNANAIEDYSFADGWSVDTDNLAEPIGDSFHDSIVVPLGKGDGMMEFNIYSKCRPNWYRSFVEKTHDLDDWFLIQESSVLDIYVNLPEEYDDLKAEDVVDAVDDAMAKLVLEGKDGTFSQAMGSLNYFNEHAEDLYHSIKK